MKIPSGHNQLMPYLIVPGAYKFIEFMKNVFGAEERIIVPRSEGLIMHGEVKIGDSVIMFADATEQFGSRPAGMFVYVESVDEAYKKALNFGASSLMEPHKESYGYTCGFHDPFGNDWWPVEPPVE